MQTRLLLKLPTLLAVAPASIAQDTLPILGALSVGQTPREDTFVLPIMRPWPSHLVVSGSYKRVLTGRLTGHIVPDVVALTGTKATLFSAPAIQSHFGEITTSQTVKDIAILTGRAESGYASHDAMAYCTDNGLHVWSMDAVTGVATSHDFAGTEWQSVTRIAAHPSDPGSIFGLTATGSVITAIDDGTGYATYGPSKSVTGQILDLEAVLWDTDGQADAAVLTTDGLYVFDRNLVDPIASFPHAASTGDITSFSDSISNGGIAWVRPSGALSEVAVARVGYTATVNISTLNEFVAIAAGDWSNDGNDEVILSSAGNETATMLVNLASDVTPFMWHQAFAMRIAVNATSASQPNQAPVAIADFDADGDMDLVAMRESLPNETTDRGYTFVKSKLYHRQLSAPLIPVAFTFSFLQPNELPLRFTAETGSTHTQLIVWEQTPDGKLLQSPILSKLVPASATGHTVNISQAHLSQGGQYAIMVRPAIVTGGVVTQVAEASIYATTSDWPQEGDGGTEVTGMPGQCENTEPPNGDPPETGNEGQSGGS